MYAYNGRGVAEYEIGKYLEALKDLSKALEFYPEFEEAKKLLLEIKLKMNSNSQEKGIMGFFRKIFKNR